MVINVFTLYQYIKVCTLNHYLFKPIYIKNEPFGILKQVVGIPVHRITETENEILLKGINKFFTFTYYAYVI